MTGPILTVALLALAALAGGVTLRLFEHRAAAAAWATRVAARIRHDARAFFINPGRRVAGRDTPKPPAQKAITA